MLLDACPTFCPTASATPPWLLQVRELEGVVHERDTMAARLAMLEARLDETRSERGQVGMGVGLCWAGVGWWALLVGAASLPSTGRSELCIQPWLYLSRVHPLRCH